MREEITYKMYIEGYDDVLLLSEAEAKMVAKIKKEKSAELIDIGGDFVNINYIILLKKIITRIGN